MHKQCEQNKSFNVKCKIGQRNLFEYLNSITILFVESGSDIDIELIDELEVMYGYDDYKDATYEHKELLKDILEVAKMTLEHCKLYKGVVGGIEYMIGQIGG